MLRLYYADVSALDPDAPEVPLSDNRRAKLASQRDPQKRRQGIGAELLLRLALSDASPDFPWPPEITVGAYGKPTWNVDGLYFSLSHSGRLAACAVADRPVGLDVQERCTYREALARRFFAPEEQRAFAGTDDRDALFGTVWSLKESWIKAEGTGLSTPLASFSVVGEARPDAAFWYGFREGCHFALCLPGAGSAEPDLFTKKKLP